MKVFGMGVSMLSYSHPQCHLANKTTHSHCQLANKTFHSHCHIANKTFHSHCQLANKTFHSHCHLANNDFLSSVDIQPAFSGLIGPSPAIHAIPGSLVGFPYHLLDARTGRNCEFSIHQGAPFTLVMCSIVVADNPIIHPFL